MLYKFEVGNQKKGKIIQGLLKKISKLKEKIILLGLGRTDTGVHALNNLHILTVKSN